MDSPNNPASTPTSQSQSQNLFDQTDSMLSAPYNSNPLSKGFNYDLSVASLIEDLNNLPELLKLSDHGWIGSDVLLTHSYFLQPPLRKGMYLPRNFIWKVELPQTSLNVSNFKFKGNEISYATGKAVSDLTIHFYENQQMQVSAYINSWISSIVGPAGCSYGLMNDYKFTMFFVHSQSSGNSIDTLASNAINKVLPSGLKSLVQSLEFSGVTILFGCFPKKGPSFTYENVRESDGAGNFAIPFQVDEMIQLPMSMDISSILEILGIDRG